MRLLDIETLKLHEFYGSKVPPYTILSHCWEENEVTYADVRDGKNTDAAGWRKIRSCCAFLRRKHHLRNRQVQSPQYVWIDTCCIDKTSSSELSEAINSMFRWYRGAVTCFAYLNDVAFGENESVISELRDSKWFTRGWTLQELLAPPRVCFVDKLWLTIIGDKYSLGRTITEITGIEDFYRSGFVATRASIATRMSWASHRVCTREEDMAYCLMGLFRVNMPLLYGEGAINAFRRLQLEILKTSNDESIFAWNPSEEYYFKAGRGMLAASTHEFRFSKAMTPTVFDTSRNEYMMTNKGLKFENAIMRTQCAEAEHIELNSSERHLYIFPLNCSSAGYRPGFPRPTPVLVWLRATGHRDFCRIFPVNLFNDADTQHIPTESFTDMPPGLFDANRWRIVGEKFTFYVRWKNLETSVRHSHLEEPQ